MVVVRRYMVLFETTVDHSKFCDTFLVLPESTTPVIKSAAISKGVAPSVEDVSAVLGRHSVKPVTKVLQVLVPLPDHAFLFL